MMTNKDTESDDYFLEDDEEEVFSSLLPESIKNRSKPVSLDQSEGSMQNNIILVF